MKKSDTILLCQNCAVESISIFSMLNMDEKRILEKSKTCISLEKGEILYREGSRMNGFYCVHQGVLKMYKTGIEGKEQIIRFAKAGDIMGYRSVLSQEPACTTAKVIERTSVCFIPASTLFELVKQNSQFSMTLMKQTCTELGEANKYIMDIAQKTVRERLAEILLLLKDTFDLDKDNTLQITLTREEIANMVGTATESVIRLLSEFKSDKLIALHGRKIQLLDIPKLQKISNVTFK